MKLTLTGLTANTTYYVRGFAQTSSTVIYSDNVNFTTAEGEEEQTVGPELLKRVSVHDPSVVWDPSSSTYYIFGSHRATAKSPNLMTWSTVTATWKTAKVNNAANNQAFVTPAVTTVKKGGKDVAFPAFDAQAWAKRGNSAYNIDGNLWAPDVIYNQKLQKWCMYMSVNGDKWYSSIVLLTADKITGPYLYQGPVVISGFYSGTAYKDTDLELVLGEQSSLPSRYATGGKWGERYPNCIDPCVFYDEQGKLWMSYGSWSGGIYMLELDEETGLRDYDVEYPLTGSGNGITVDPYFGKKIAGGYYASGEASYIEYIGGYYFLFVTNGGLAAGGVSSDYNNGGYQMRVFRSKSPDGPYVDGKDAAALYTGGYLLNFGPNENDGNRGVNIFGAYGDWGYQATGNTSERSQGHNSIIAAPDGRTYLVYHTRFQNMGEMHEVRVHQVFQNQDGWLVAAPFEYTGETVKSADIASKQKIAKGDIPGKYKVLIHTYKLNHLKKEYIKPKEAVLNADGTVSGGVTGSWSIQEGSSYITLTLAGAEYKGVMVEQTLEQSVGQKLSSYDKAACFTALNTATGITVWGYRYSD
ncbi:MAG: glycoside hydrolase family 43 protein [Prevotella sp.]|nr:glycoside hydrolase family 43 protein [Prevotella sp.]